MPDKKDIKYFKPKSLTWWAGIVSIIAGGILCVIKQNVEGKELIALGLVAIGIRGAV